MADIAMSGLATAEEDRREYTMEDAVYRMHEHDDVVKEVRQFHKLILKEISRW